MLAPLLTIFPIDPLPPVTVEAGELPIIISAPHGGRQRLEGVLDRVKPPAEKDRPNGSGYSVAFDSGTDALARATADEIARRLGKRPYLVVSNITRRQFDANRPETIGVDGEGARPAYRSYHDALARFRAAIVRKFGTGLLLDLHGQGSTAEAIYRGTSNGLTVTGLPREALVGKDGLLGRMEAQGVRFIPACDEEGKREASGLSGGWIVRHYGATQESDGSGGQTPDQFWAVQLECGLAYRRKDAIPATAAKIADAVAAFARANLALNSGADSPRSTGRGRFARG